MLPIFQSMKKAAWEKKSATIARGIFMPQDMKQAAEYVERLEKALSECETTEGAPALAHPDKGFADRRLRAINEIARIALAKNRAVKFTPQAWVNDNAITVDPLGKTEWPLDCDEFPGEFEPDTHESDNLRFSRHAPEWAQDWSGPFYCEIIQVDGDKDGNSICNDVTTGEALAALLGLMQYVGGWDEKGDHPCANAVNVLKRAGIAS